VRVYEGPGGEVYEVELPPRSAVDLEGLRVKLGMPTYLDLTDPLMQRALVTIWASAIAPSAFKGIREGRSLDAPLLPLLMGGAAVKVLSPSANVPGGPMNRRIHDLDFVLPRSQAGKFVLLLSLLDGVAGSRFKHFLTSNDKRFNALRAGERYRVRGLDWVDLKKPAVSVVDVFVEKIDMRHRVPVSNEFARAEANLHTIGFEKLIMSKCQLISDFDSKDVTPADRLEDRVLRWPHYRQDKLIIGMEEKDMLDVCALLLDGEESGRPDVGRLRRELSDQKFLLTVRLNLENLLSREGWMKAKGLSQGQVSHVKEACARILSALPEIDKKWSKPWWNTDVDTPSVN
jgi:hypothetical protein